MVSAGSVVDFWKGRRVLVTGHTGFKGSWLSLWLLELGAELWGISLKPSGSPNLFDQLQLGERLHRHHIADIRDEQVLRDFCAACEPEVVFHLAAQALVRRSYSDPLGTWATNVQGSLHLLEALKFSPRPCSVVMVTTDKVYANQEWCYGYRENDRLGGHDPYSASKAAAELAIASWRSSFCGPEIHQTRHLAIATARAGNVIGGGDWAADRIIPDTIRALSLGRPVELRNPQATRPWQHVLEPLGGYLRLAEALSGILPLTESHSLCDAFNFGPALEANRTVRQLVDTVLMHWPGDCLDQSNAATLHEAGLLHLHTDKARHYLGWQPQWSFPTTIKRTVQWYKEVHEGADPLRCCLADLNAYRSLTTISNPLT